MDIEDMLGRMGGDRKIKNDTELRRLRRHPLYPQFRKAGMIALATWLTAAKGAGTLILDRYLPVPADFYLLFLSPIAPRRN